MCCSKYQILGILLLVVLLLYVAISLLPFGFIIGDGQRFSSASRNSKDAKWRGVYLRPLAATVVERNPVPVDAWVETVYEYSTRYLIVKGKSGVRVCVRFEDGSSISNRIFCRHESEQMGVGERTSSRDSDVFSCQAENFESIPLPGKLHFYQSINSEPTFSVELSAVRE